MAKVIALVGNNKRVAFDVLTAELEATEDLLRAPEGYAKRRLQNFIQNEDKAKVLKDAAKNAHELGNSETEQAGIDGLEVEEQVVTEPHVVAPTLGVSTTRTAFQGIGLPASAGNSIRPAEPSNFGRDEQPSLAGLGKRKRS